MSACPFGECDGSGLVWACVEPMAGPAGYESTPCRCAVSAPVDAFAIAAACTDETCGGECMAPTVSPIEAAWAEVDRRAAENAATHEVHCAAERDWIRAHYAYHVARAAAETIGPRPVKDLA